MKKRLGIAITLGVLVILPVATIVLAQVSANFNLSWYVIAGGGQSQSPTYMVQATLGEWAGDTSSCGQRNLQTGFLYGIVFPSAAPCKTYMPMALKNLLPYFEGPWEVEPNNSIAQANGPLRSGQAYNGHPSQSDPSDYFSIYLATTGEINAAVTNFYADGDLVLRNSSGIIITRWGGSGNKPLTMIVTATGLPAGWYYIQVYVDTSKPVDPNKAYMLTATYP